MKYGNPFHGMAYITEKDKKINDVLKKYSIMPIEQNIEDFVNTNNIFLVGRRGVGKTMILSLFDPEYQNYIYNNYENFSNIGELIPNDIISVYLNLQSASYPLKRFKGKNIENNEWQTFFGDFLGFVILDNLLSTFELIKNNDFWARKIKLAIKEKQIYNKLAESVSTNLNKYIGTSIVNIWEDFLKIIKNRIDSWLSAVSSHSIKYCGPDKTIDLIKPSFIFFEELKKLGFIPKYSRLFIILDQYDFLFNIREPIDLRPVFNHALAQASRGKTGIEFKIGVRPYGYLDNLKILDSTGKLDIGKECLEINLDDKITGYYRKFIEDLTLKCLQNQPGFEKFDSANEFFEEIDEYEEVFHYIENSLKKNLHFKDFFTNQKYFSRNIINNLILADSKGRFQSTDDESKKIIFETFLCVYLEKHFKKPSDKTMQKRMTIEYLEKFIKEMGDILEILVKEGKKGSISDKDYSMFNQCKDGILFILSKIYSGKSLKIYSGLDELTKISSFITLHFVKIVDSAISEYILDKNPKKFEKLPFKYQTRAVHKLSKEYFEEIRNRSSYGLHIQRFFNNLGNYFKKNQILPYIPKPTPNGFSVINELLDYFYINSIEWNVYAEILGRGFLEKIIHNTAGQEYKPKRYKYYFNRLLCPYFNLSYKHLKTPIYLRNELEILSSLINKDFEMKRIYKDLDELIESEKYNTLDKYIKG